MSANKHKGIRSALCWNNEICKLSREHNNANILSIPSRYVSVEQAIEMIETFINTPFEGGRHQARVEKINS
jgi:ribose 5-phosphate isomerase B